MKKILIILSLIILAFLNCNSQQWVRASGMSGKIVSLAVKSKQVFALADKDGVFSSSDYGKTWEKHKIAYDLDTFDYKYISSLMLIRNSKIYASIRYNGFYYSSNDGESWVQLDLPNPFLKTFDVENNNIVINTDIGVYISKDNGLTWNDTKFGIYEYINSLKIKDSNIFVCTYYLYVSTDYGKTWSKYGSELPDDIISLEIIGDTIYAGTDGSGIFKSTDKGKNWFPINNGLTYFKVNTIVIDGNNIFAGTNGKAIFLSTNGGQNWTRLNNDFAWEYYDINSIAVQDNYVFAGGDGEILYSSDYGKKWEIINNAVGEQIDYLYSNNSNVYASTYEGLYLSTDHGLSWSLITQDFFRKEDFSISAISSIEDKLLISTYFNGIYTSTNKGKSWDIQSNGIPEFGSVHSFTTNDTIIFAVVDNGIVYRSSDKGNSWFPIKNIQSEVYSIAIKDSLVIAGTDNGIYLSTDHGITWSQTGNEIYVRGIYSLIFKDNYIFAGTIDNGVLLSTDNGISWVTANIGMGESPVTSFAVSGNTVYAGTKGAGVFYSTNNGKMWIQKLKGLKTYDIYSLITIGDTVIAVGGPMYFTTNNSDNWTTKDTVIYNSSYEANPIYYFNKEIYYGDYGGISKSSDFGDSWIKLDSGLFKKEYTGFYDNVAFEDSKIVIADYHKLFLSSDSGKNWVFVDSLNEYIRTLELHNNTLYVSTVKGFFKSSDFGQSWFKSDNGLVDSSLDKFSFDDDRILTRSNGKFFISYDNAESWTQTSDFPPNFSITDYELSDNYIIISTAWEGIILSSDLGKTWIYGSVNPLYTLLIIDIEVKDNIVFAGCMYKGIFYSSDYGQNWMDVNTSILKENYDDVCIWTLTISDDNYVYTSPHSRGVYRLNIDDITGINEKPIENNDLFSISPNPSTTTCTISFSESGLCRKFQLFNCFGEDMTGTITHTKINGSNIQFDVSALSGGVYFAVLELNGRHYSKPFVVVK